MVNLVKRMTAIITAVVIMMTVSAQAADGVKTYVESDTFANHMDIASNTIKEFGDKIDSNKTKDKNKKKKKTKEEKFKESKEKASWEVDDVVSMYEEGYSLEDIGTAMTLAPKMDTKPFKLLEKKGKTKYDIYEVSENSKPLTINDADPEKGVTEYDNKKIKRQKKEKSWKTVIAEVNGDEVAADEDMQTIKENGLTDFIDMSVLSDYEIEYLTTEDVFENENISLMSLSREASDTVATAYNNEIFPKIKYNQFNAGNSVLETEEVNINPLTGNATVRATDLTLKGRNGLDLNLTRVNSGINTCAVTPMVGRSNLTITTERKTFYSVTGCARVTVWYNEPLPNGSYKEEFDSQEIVFKPYEKKVGIETKYRIAGISALENDRERLSRNAMPSCMFDSLSAAQAAFTAAEEGKYDMIYLFTNNEIGKIKAIKFEVISDLGITEVINEGTHNVEKTSEGYDIYYTDWYDYSMTDKYFDIGLGWEFDFPYIERIFSNLGSVVEYSEFLHFGSKGVWRIDDNDNLDGYYLNDIELIGSGRYKGTSYTWVVKEKDGKTYYFGNLGELRVIADRFENDIEFEYNITTLENGLKYPHQLTKITDTVGREINFDYSNPLQTVITVVDKNDSSQNRVIKYNKTLAEGSSDDYLLTSVVDAENNETEYEYQHITGGISLTSKDLEARNAIEVDYYHIQTILKPTKMLITLTPSTSKNRNFGVDGAIDRVMVSGYTYSQPIEDDGEEFEEYYQKSYSNRNPIEYDGYPFFSNTEEIPEELSTTVRCDEYYYYGNEKHEKLEYSKSDKGNWLLKTKTMTYEGESSRDVMWRERTEYEYNNLEQCIKETHEKYNNPDDQTSWQSNVYEYTYDSGKYNDILKVKKFGNDEYSVNYEYDSTYHIPTKKTYKQDSDTTIIENYTLTDDKKSVASVTVTENNATRHKLDYEYDSYGNVILEKRYTGKNNWNDFISIGYSYDDLSNKTNKINGANVSRIYVTGVNDADGLPVDEDGTIDYLYTYDWFGNVLTETDSNGNLFSYSYDKINRPVQYKNPQQGTINMSYGYGLNNNYVQTTDENGNVMKYSYYSDGQIKEEKDITANKVLKSYLYSTAQNPYYAISTATNHSDYGNTTSLTTYFDSLGRVEINELKNSAGTVIYREEYLYEQAVDNLYDCVTKTVKGETGAEDYITKQYTDKFGNIVKEEVIYNNNGTQESIVTEYTYDYLGNVLTVKSPRAMSENWTGNVFTTQYEYNIDGQVTKTTDIYGNYSINEYDGLGRLIRSADAEATASATPYYSTFVYDTLGRLLKSQTPIDANGTMTESIYYYDNNSNVTKSKVKNADGYSVTETQYDWRNNPIKVLTDGTDTAYYYDSVGNVLRMYTGELGNLVISGLDNVSGADYEVTKYTYDTQNRPITSTDALGMVVTNTYDVNGNLVKTVDKNNNILNYVYDPIGNLIEKSSQSDENSQKENVQTYTYNRMNLPLTVTAGGITSTYTYDNLGQLLKEELTTGEVKEYNYDKVGNVTLFKLTKDGVQKFNTVYSYDKLDRVQSITNGTNVSSYTYDRNGRLSESTTNGTTTTYGYNRAGWVTSLATQSGNSQLQSHSYQYYPDGNISQKQSTVGTLSEQVSYQYDDAGRLVREQTGNDITEFTYDNYSNRATMTNGNTANTYTYDANNRLLKTVKTQNNKDEITNYIYDNNGNQIAWYKGSISPSGGTSSLALTDETDGTDYGYYTYDAFNRLSTYTNGVTNASYTYGADNLRKSKTVDGVTTNYVWNGSNMVLEENSTGINKYYYGADGIAFADFNGTTNYYQKNAHGDITALTNANGTITRNYQFDAFGNELTDNTNDINPFRYAGQYQDDETGLIYLRNRYYDRNNGRFITEDPIKDGLNWYVYCGNNPVNLIDPLGLFDYDDKLSYSQTYNQDVEVLQDKLVWLGYMETPADGEWGYFGFKTQEAVNAYKNDMGLWNFGEYKGVVGVTTWKSLGLIYRSQADINAGVKIVTIDRNQYFDVTIPFDDLLYDAKNEAEKWYNKMDLIWFYGKVNHKEEWDIKRPEPWFQTLGITYPGSADATIIYSNTFCSPEYLGNFLYGYAGTAASIPEEVLIAGSMYASGVLSGQSTEERIINELNDHSMIRDGINAYK